MIPLQTNYKQTVKRSRHKNLPLRDENGELVFVVEYAPEWPEAQRHKFSLFARNLYVQWFGHPGQPNTNSAKSFTKTNTLSESHHV